jgi:predicted nucleic-acid-binding Zn-ribbon protein
MRKRAICPKCDHDEILFLPQIADRDDDDVVRPLVVHVVHYDWKDDLEMGKLSAYVCRKCGFTEMYTKDAANLPVDKIPGARILKGTRDPSNPFR